MAVMWVFAVTALAYAVLGAWRLSLGRGGNSPYALVVAFLAMAVWALSDLSGLPVFSALGQFARSAAWIAYLAQSTQSLRERSDRRWAGWERALLLLAVLAAATTLSGIGDVGLVAPTSWLLVALTCRLMFAIGAIVYLHNVHSGLSDEAGTGFRLIVVGLGILWAYDLNLYTVGLLGFGLTGPLAAGRPLVALLLVPLFAIAARRRERWRIALSRQATFQSLSMVAIGLYFVGMSVSSRAVMLLGGSTGVVLGVVATIVLSSAAAAILLLPNVRAWVKVVVTKHLFSHRYDYRTEWLRFSATIADVKASELTLEERVVKAVAEVTESPAGLLLVADARDAFTVAASRNWDWHASPGDEPVALPPAVVQSLRDGLITRLDADAARPAAPLSDGEAREGTAAWIAVPLIGLSAMVGIVILSRPRLPRELDWEDFDLLKVIGQQAAVHLSDAHSQLELEEARRFDEFNRRFSYIIHDIKNVVSQLSLVASNAQQHGSNPKFQVEMNRSLTSAVEKMTVLLARLSPDRVFQAPDVAPIELAPLLQAVAAGRAGQRTLAIDCAAGARAVGDADKLKLAIEHLVQNAIEASPADKPIVVAAACGERRCTVTVTDRGTGMSAEFIRKGLFKPFVSTKGGGFGIGAAEAKALVAGMGGTLTVSSSEGQGSRFTIDLPSASPRA